MTVSAVPTIPVACVVTMHLGTMSRRRETLVAAATYLESPNVPPPIIR
ncbi:hypothetical protein [Tautonia plasticadhaerens]|nr:hypothetical protein [Tautonia plasticadhaerens]